MSMKEYDTTENGGLRKKQTTERWSDISNAPIDPGDILKIFNEASEVNRSFQIINIEDNADSTIRLIKARVIDTTDPNERIGVEVDFNLPRAQPILGALIRMDEKFERLTAIEANDLMAVELYKWLMSRASANYGATFKLCVEFLKGAGFVPPMEVYTVAQNRVRAMMRQRGELFRSSGGKIFGTGVDLQHQIKSGKDFGGGAIVIKRIKLNKLYMGIRLILESGILGECVLEE
jgi:hypothetical protein